LIVTIVIDYATETNTVISGLSGYQAVSAWLRMSWRPNETKTGSMGSDGTMMNGITIRIYVGHWRVS
jgi:hypothetical protein